MSGKPVSDLTAEDLARCPVWEFDNDNEALPGRDETWVVPVADLPITSLANRVVAATLRFGDREALGLLGNIELHDVRATREFATLSVCRGGSWFQLNRYFDPGYERHGPEQLARFLGLPRAEVFPILYDISAVAVGHPEVVRGRITAEPEARLTDDERMELVFEGLGGPA
jgi:hypothetical protein